MTEILDMETLNSNELRNPITERGGEKIQLPTKPDGWLSPSGIYRECESDEHDSTAWDVIHKDFPGESEKIIEQVFDSQTNQRKFLFEQGYIQLSGGRVIASNRPTDEQSQFLDKENYKIPVTLSDQDLWKHFEGVKMKLKLGLLGNQVLFDLQEFLDHNLRFSVDNDPWRARELFNELTTGFEELGSFSYRYGYERNFEYKRPKTDTFAVELLEHRHDGYSGLQYTSWISVIPEAEIPYNDIGSGHPDINYPHYLDIDEELKDQ